MLPAAQIFSVLALSVRSVKRNWLLLRNVWSRARLLLPAESVVCVSRRSSLDSLSGAWKRAKESRRRLRHALLNWKKRVPN